MKRYLKKTALFILLILLTCLGLAFLALNRFYVSSFVVLLVLTGESYCLFKHMENNSRSLMQFIWSVKNANFLTSYNVEKEHGDISPELAGVMKDALKSYQEVIQEKESQMQYFHALADHIDLSVLVYTPNGAIEWLNQAAKQQIGIASPGTLDDLKEYHPDLPARLRSLRPGETSILQINRGQEVFQIILSGISFVVRGKSLTVVSMKNIRSVLEDKETEAWMKLIRVLTHEIMNSMTPIVSLAELLKGKFNAENILSPEEQQELNHAVETISKRGSGLVQFVENYRKVTGIPSPVMQVITVRELIQDVIDLMKRENHQIKALIPYPHLQIIADRGQIEQILINLIKNAMEATIGIESAEIEILTGINTDGYTYIKINDNGIGISPQVLERIFIPFFTTKPSGSGLGLSISRQIMHMHKGMLTVTSIEGKGSSFTLTFC